MRVVVCVTGQRSCERLILHGVERAKKLQAQLCVVHVVGMKAQLLGLSSESEAIAYLFTIARDNGAEVTILRNDDFLQAMGEYTAKNETLAIVMGGTPPGARRDMARELKERLPDIELYVLPYIAGDSEGIEPPEGSLVGAKICASLGNRKEQAGRETSKRSKTQSAPKSTSKKESAKKEPTKHERKSKK